MFGYAGVARPAEISDGQSQTIMLIGSGKLAGPWVHGGGATIRGAREPYFDELSGFGSAGLTSKGALTVMADGSVRVIGANISPQVFKAMSTIHGAETVDLSHLSSVPPPLLKPPQVKTPPRPLEATEAAEEGDPETGETTETGDGTAAGGDS
jgi:hypothetical protein